MRKSLVILVVVLVIVGGVFIYQNRTSGEIVLVGFVAPLTGKQANYGEAVQEGIKLALEESGFKAGRHELKVIYEDSGSDVAKAVSAVQKLISIDGVDVILAGGPSQEPVALMPIVQEQKVPMFAVIGQAKELTTGDDYVFRGLPELTGLANRASEVAWQSGYKTAVTITANFNQATLEGSRLFETKFSELGGKIVGSEDFSKDTTDFRTILQNVKSKKPDVIFLNALTNELALVLKQKDELGIEIPFLSQGSAEDLKVIEVAGVGANGVVFATYNATPPPSFDKKIQDLFGRESRRLNIEGYEAMQIVMDAIRNSESADSEGIREALSKIRTYKGVTATISYDSGGNVNREIYIKEIKNGKFGLVE